MLDIMVEKFAVKPSAFVIMYAPTGNGGSENPPAIETINIEGCREERGLAAAENELGKPTVTSNQSQ